MLRLLLERLVLVGSVVMLILLHCSSARPRRRFCENFPFARMCLGVAAKRSAQQYDLNARQKSAEVLSTMIKRLLAEKAREQLDKPVLVQDKSDLYEDTPFLDELESMVRNKNHRPIVDQPTYITDDPTWAEDFDNSKRQL